MIIVDVETGGLDARKNPLLSIGAIDFKTGNGFYGECYPREDLVIEDQALAVNGFTRDYLKQINTDTKTLIEKFLEWVEQTDSEYVIAGENPSFDNSFITENCKFYNIKNPFGYRTVDLHSICYARILMNGKTPPQENRKDKVNLDYILEYVGLSAEPRPHNALRGAKSEYEAFKRLLE